MGDDAVYSVRQKGVVGGEAREAALVYGAVRSARIVAAQMLEEGLGLRRLAVLALESVISHYRHVPALQMDVNSNVDILSAEIIFVTLSHGCVSF